MARNEKNIEKLLPILSYVHVSKELGDASAPLKRYSDVERPFQCKHIDVIGAMGESDNRYIHCFVDIDVLTRYLVKKLLKGEIRLNIFRSR